LQVILRDDTALVNKRGGFRVYVGNLAPSVGWQMLHEHFTRGFHENDAVELRSKVPVDAAGQPLGFGLVEFRQPQMAAQAVRLLHNSALNGRLLFVRHDCDASEADRADAAALAAARQHNHALIRELSRWTEHAPPLMGWGWHEGGGSCWAAAPEFGAAQGSFACAQLIARVVLVRLSPNPRHFLSHSSRPILRCRSSTRAPTPRRFQNCAHRSI
jgi:RNA recognition motif-containing protein